MVSNMKKTLAGVALAALPLMASAQMNEMKDQALSDVSGQLGIIDITNIGFGVALFDVPGAIGPALIDPIDLELTNFGPTLSPFDLGIKVGLFDVIPGVGPALIDLPEATFKASVLGGIGAAIGTTYILQNGLVLPIPRVSVTPTRVL